MVYRINKPDVVFEYFKDETVLINLKSGNYYSIDKVGTDILSLIEKKETLNKIINHIKIRYNASAQDIDDSVKEFITQLHNEKIIKQEISSGREKKSSEKKASSQSENIKKVSFSPPRLSKYTDMQELLLLDPIHDVDETGWPKKKSNNSSYEK